MCSHQAHIGNWIKAGLKHSKVHVPKRAHWLRFSAEAEGEREREETKSSGHRTMAALDRPPPPPPPPPTPPPKQHPCNALDLRCRRRHKAECQI